MSDLDVDGEINVAVFENGDITVTRTDDEGTHSGTYETPYDALVAIVSDLDEFVMSNPRVRMRAHKQQSRE